MMLRKEGETHHFFGAVFYDRRDVVKFLISKGADVNKKAKDGETPLLSPHKTVLRGHLQG